MADRDIRKEVTERIIASLEQGVLPWRRSWRDDSRGSGLPTNASTGRTYNGGNRLILLAAGMDAGYQDNRWLTFNQAKALGGAVMKGEHGTAIEYWETRPFWKRKGIELEYQGKPVKMGPWPKTDHPKTITLADGREVNTKDVTVLHDGKRHTWRQAEQMLSTMISKVHIVFNVEQCRDLNIEQVQRSPDPEFGKARNIVRGMQEDGVALHHGGNRAFYNVGRDAITMPHHTQFDSQERYVGTLLHELGHATGHPDRNNRPLGNAFGSPDYAKEELIAELTSAFVAAETGVGFDDQDHASYIGSWLDALGKDKHEVFRAAKAASHAADYLIARGREVEKKMSVGWGQEAEPVAKTITPEELALREMWTKNGVSPEKQDELIASIAAKAAPGAEVGPFRVPEKLIRRQSELER